jgi:hypothetical protein
VSEQNPAPLILALALDAASTTRFEALRREHFPPGRNLVPAHLAPFPVLAEGLLLWRYVGGPWQAAGRYLFTC